MKPLRGPWVIYPIAARCGVFAKTDIQPLINEGAPIENLAACHLPGSGQTITIVYTITIV